MATITERGNSSSSSDDGSLPPFERRFVSGDMEFWFYGPGAEIYDPDPIPSPDCAFVHEMFPGLSPTECCGYRSNQTSSPMVVSFMICNPVTRRIEAWFVQVDWLEPPPDVCNDLNCGETRFVYDFTPLAKLVELRHLYFMYDIAEAPWPKELGNLTKLESLAVIAGFSGTIPVEWNSLDRLKQL
ncbi:hypothetical protein HDU96_001083 [Phlyctochytrium bullatum]|nr:hypothetical protein HDU96_001083 [Phlyctochytrium bullatum]